MTRYELQEAQAQSAVYRLRDGLQYEARKLDELRRAAAVDGMGLREWMRAQLDAAGNDYMAAWLRTGVGLSIMWLHARHGRWQYVTGGQ